MTATFGRRASPPSPLARLAAMALALLTLLDLAFRYALTGQSALWSQAEQALAAASGLPAGTPALAAAGLLLGLLLAALLWFRFGRVAALLLSLLAAWEIYGRARQLQAALRQNLPLDPPLLAGLAAALLLALVALLALAGTFGQSRRKRWWR